MPLKGRRYSTKLDESAVKDYYRNVFEQAGFRFVSDKASRGGAHVLSYFKDGQTCYVRIERLEEGLRVSLLSYVNPEGTPGLKKMTWADILMLTLVMKLQIVIF